MGRNEDLEYGWKFMAQVLGADMDSQGAVNSFADNVMQNQAIDAQNYKFQQVNDAIDNLAQSINEHRYAGLDPEQFKGVVAEEMHARTFNINALRNDSSHRAWTLHENGYASVDVETNFGKNYILKYSNTAGSAENMQAAINPETGLPKYSEQELLIASEQVDEAKVWAHKRYLKDLAGKPNLSEAHAYAEEHLTGKITDGEGIESNDLSIKEAKKIAKEAQKGRFDPERHGINKEVMLDEVRINYMNQALKAGLTAASITAITQIVPELYKAIDYLIKNGEIDLNVLAKSGEKVVSASAEAFLQGAIAYGVEMAIQNGLLGEALEEVSPSIVGVAVVVILRTVKDSILVAAGKMTAKEMGMHFVDSLMVSSGYLVGMKIGGIVAQALFPELPGISYAIGSLLGCSIAVAYSIGKKKLISFCVDTGFTCFGLVEQDYELPEKVLSDMGVHTIPVPRTEVSRTEVESVDVNTQIDRTEYETVDLTVLKRGIIGVNRIGYVPA